MPRRQHRTTLGALPPGLMIFALALTATASRSGPLMALAQAADKPANTPAALPAPEPPVAPIHPDEARVIAAIIAREGYKPQVAAVPAWRLTSAKRTLEALGVEANRTAQLRAWQIDVRDDPRPHRGGFLCCIYDQAGRTLALSGNGPWLNNESLADLAAMTELRSLRWDHNGFVGRHPQAALYSGAGLAALAASKLGDLKIGLGFADEGMTAAAKITSLQTVAVVHSRITDAGIAAFEGHPTLKAFSVGEMASGRVTPGALASVAKMPALTRLGFHELVLPYEGGLSHLVGLRDRLTDIDLSMCLVTDEDLARVRADHPAAKVTTISPAEIVSRHIGVAKQLAKTARGAPAQALNAALVEAEKAGPKPGRPR